MPLTQEGADEIGSNRHERLALITTLSAISVAALVLSALSAYDQVDGTTVTTLQAHVRQGLSSGYLFMVLSPLVVALVAFVRRRWVIGAMSVVLVPVLFFGAVVTYFAVNPAPYDFDSAVEAADGETYYFGESSFLQGQLLGIFQHTSTGRFTVTAERIVQTNGDSPRMTGKVIRPADEVRDERYNQLYLSPDRTLVVGNRYDNCAYLAYDTKTGARWNHSDMFGPDDDTNTHAVNTLSPFVLIGPDDELHQPDVDALLDDSAKCSNSALEILPDEVIEQGRKHVNPQVREIAKKLVAVRAKMP